MKKHRLDRKNRKKYGYILLSSFILILFFCLGAWIYHWNSGFDKRLSENEYYNTKTDDKVNLVFYKAGCPYCQAGKSAVLKQVKNSKIDTYFINAKTEKGISIAKEYHVRFAPTIVMIRNGEKKMFLYAHDKGKKIVVEKQKIKEAFKK
ncbi:thioredoxin family protein [Streptococcus iniae]|nr:thioredoxin family protein [Streptococcus iniae]